MRAQAQSLIRLLRWLVRHKRSSSTEQVLLMTGMVLTRTTSLVAASICSSLVALEIWLRTQAIWPLIWLGLEAVFLVLRCVLIVNARRAHRHRREGPVLVYIASGCAWAASVHAADGR